MLLVKGNYDDVILDLRAELNSYIHIFFSISRKLDFFLMKRESIKKVCASPAFNIHFKLIFQKFRKFNEVIYGFVEFIFGNRHGMGE